MTLVRRANVVLEIKDEELEFYLNDGYKQIDPVTGATVKEASLHTLESYRDAYFAEKKKVEALEKEVQELKAKLDGVESVKVSKSRQSKKTE